MEPPELSREAIRRAVPGRALLIAESNTLLHLFLLCGPLRSPRPLRLKRLSEAELYAVACKNSSSAAASASIGRPMTLVNEPSMLSMSSPRSSCAA